MVLFTMPAVGAGEVGGRVSLVWLVDAGSTVIVCVALHPLSPVFSKTDVVSFRQQPALPV